MNGTNKDTDKAVRKFGEDAVIPELSTYLERHAEDFEKNYRGAIWAMREWSSEPKKIKGEDNPLYAMKDERRMYFGERAAKHEIGQLLHESLWGILNTEGYKSYSESKKENRNIINTLPRIQ
ncbi:MAG: hypothetical protein QF584_02695, partial [Candidatus Woesearchaeota archaeon]|nr:hypothetical protein [Candidatus Woesearchaeota archaeon]